MLHKEPFIVEEATFKLIQELQSLKEFAGFVLVGGTALPCKWDIETRLT
ncbi:MAG: hypothetical protein NW207_01510 [Cytophagales bacterium]|nr:hypothetical protein [Cytophagales bacterium]